MYSFSYLEPVCCSMSSSNCCFLTCIQILQEAGQVVWYTHLFQKFQVYCDPHTVKGFGIVNKAEIDVFLELSCFFDDPADVGNLISGSSTFSETSLNIWKFTVHILLKPGLENFEHYFTREWDECNCVVVWTFTLSGDKGKVKESKIWSTQPLTPGHSAGSPWEQTALLRTLHKAGTEDWMWPGATRVLPSWGSKDFHGKPSVISLMTLSKHDLGVFFILYTLFLKP